MQSHAVRNSLSACSNLRHLAVNRPRTLGWIALHKTWPRLRNVTRGTVIAMISTVMMRFFLILTSLCGIALSLVGNPVWNPIQNVLAATRPSAPCPQLSGTYHFDTRGEKSCWVKHTGWVTDIMVPETDLPFPSYTSSMAIPEGAVVRLEQDECKSLKVTIGKKSHIYPLDKLAKFSKNGIRYSTPHIKEAWELKLGRDRSLTMNSKFHDGFVERVKIHCTLKRVD